MVHLVKVYNPMYIFATLTIAFFGSYSCITLYEQYRLCYKENNPKLLNPTTLLFCMAVSVGGVAIWTMHFVAIAGVQFFDPTDHKRVLIKFRIDLTIVSLFAVILCSFCGLYLCSRDKGFVFDKSAVVDKYVEDLKGKSIQEIRKIDTKLKLIAKSLFRNMITLLIGGVLVAGGVCVMHYVGMLAIVYPGHIEWNVFIVVASVVIALVAASAALWILFRLLALFPEIELLRMASAVIMAVAVNGMHYTGMTAGNFVYDESVSVYTASVTVASNIAAFNAVIGSVIFLLIMIVIAIADLRVWYYHLSLVIRETDRKADYYEALMITPAEPFLQVYRLLRGLDNTAQSRAYPKAQVIAVHQTRSKKSNRSYDHNYNNSANNGISYNHTAKTQPMVSASIKPNNTATSKDTAVVSDAKTGVSNGIIGNINNIQSSTHNTVKDKPTVTANFLSSIPFYHRSKVNDNYDNNDRRKTLEPNKVMVKEAIISTNEV